MSKKRERLREGFSTGACAAAAAKAAALRLSNPDQRVDDVTISFPDGLERTMGVAWTRLTGRDSAEACVVKDAGDDPDVTDGAEIIAMVEIEAGEGKPDVKILGGTGVGTVTKPGLAINPGEPAINPVPRQMIRQAVLSELGNIRKNVKVTIKVPQGKRLAGKTLNKRLGIVGGISILGTTGIVKPISEAAWCATITVSMDVALAVGLDTVCLSTGRSSEEAAMRTLNLREEAFIAMGDYVGFSLKEVASRPFKKVIIACQWSKLVKMAMGWNQTHVRFGPLDPEKAARFMHRHFGMEPCQDGINTVRQLLAKLQGDPGGADIIRGVCSYARDRLGKFLPDGQALNLILVSYDKKIIHTEP